MPFFNEKGVSEKVTLSFDFTQELLGETIVEANVAVTTVHGVDPNPIALLNSAPSISGGFILQGVKGGVGGVTYNLLCTANTSAARVLTLAGQLPVSLQ